ncbi:TPA: type II toxin-antitoxin system VapC family toxin [Candidatus Woesearchaeota archaeon]|nr:hypothetical protein [uncultured archaeon]AQS32050.1 hypothetical protein [uncultured archaeon]MBS3115243.1 type II toxin-antitoxin system VapC family toxin [Candidatus Woesearchaeota archaeon]HIH39750.1 type II toxin-antitoxin system VapC family toxin [Candidatus Woesearchaeota archaeon]
MIFLDANIFLAHDNINDVHHEKALLLWKRIESGEFEQYFTSDYVINEVVGVTLRKFGKDRAIAIGKQILNAMNILNIDEHMLIEAWGIFTETKLALNLVDCTNIIAARIADAKFIATFDKEFKKSEGISIID